jgi:predicted lipoprotein with Yx(FWY)xxD motif
MKEQHDMMFRSPQKNVGLKFSPRTITMAALFVASTAMLGTAVLPTVGGATASPTTIKVTQNSSWGPTLSLKNGDTLYRLSADSMNKSNCNSACAKVWPPVLLAKGQTKAVGVGVSGLGSIAHAGGTKQVTLDGIPLYRFVGDKSPGQVTGNITDTWGKWFSINPASPRTAPKKKSSGGGGATTTTTSGGGIAY